jgi:hypothetical protein
MAAAAGSGGKCEKQRKGAKKGAQFHGVSTQILNDSCGRVLAENDNSAVKTGLSVRANSL